MSEFLAIIKSFVPLFLTVIISAFGLWLSNRILIKKASLFGNEGLFYRRLIILGLMLAALIAVILAIPINPSSRNQIIALVSLLISGIFAFSSGNIFSNLMAGILLRVTEPFKIGDFIYVDDFFGRVSERGLFDTEIQSESRELIAIPNAFLLSRPIKTVRGSGAIVSVNLSLGYDVNHVKVEELLLKAAKRSKLSDPFVHIIELGDFTVNYRLSGLLSEIKGLITARSNLYREVLDVLHAAGVEIMSPTVVNQRRIDENAKVLPEAKIKTKVKKKVVAEDIVFDKAEKAVQTDQEKEALLKEIQSLEDSISEVKDEEKEALKAQHELKIEELKEVQSILDGTTKPDINLDEAKK